MCTGMCMPVCVNTRMCAPGDVDVAGGQAPAALPHPSTHFSPGAPQALISHAAPLAGTALCVCLWHHGQWGGSRRLGRGASPGT